MIRRYQKFKRRHRCGAVAIEFAMIAPTFLVVIAICAEFARLSMLRNLAHNAAYESARLLMTEGTTIQDGIDKANEIMGRLGARNVTVTINGNDGSTDESGNVIGELDNKTIEVTCNISLPLKDNSLIIPESIVGETTIRSSITVRTERYRGFFDSQMGD